MQLGNPRLLLPERLDPRSLAPQGLVDRQGGKLPLGLFSQTPEMVQALLVLLHAGIDGVEPLDGPFRHGGTQLPPARKLFIQRRPLSPSLAEGNGQIRHPRQLLGAVGLFLQPGNFLTELIVLGRQVTVAAVDRPEVFDLGAEFFPLGEQLDHLAWLAGRVQQAIPRVFQLPQYFHQRHAIQAGRQIVEQLGGLGVAQGGQLLDFAQAHGEHVVEHRLVDVRQEHLEEVLALPRAVGRGERHLLVRAAVGQADCRSGRSGTARAAPPDQSSRRLGPPWTGGRYRRRGGEKP